MSRKTVYNGNLTSNWENVSRENKQLVKDFISYLKSCDKSPQTIYQYGEWLKVFFSWNYAENEDKFFVNLKKRDFVNYFGYLRDLGLSPNRIASLKSGVSSLSNEIELLYEDMYPNFHNQLRGLEAIHITPVREKTVLSDTQLEDMLKQLYDSGEYQIACYLALVCASGARKSELIQFKTTFFVDSNEVFDGKMWKTPEIRSKGRGKRGKIINKYVIKSAFKPFLDKWIEERAKLCLDHDYLFVDTITKKPASISTANAFARLISNKFNIDFYAHSGRHYFCGLLRGMDLPDEIIRIIFSWESVDLIKVYDDTPADDRIAKWFRQNNTLFK